MRHLTMVEAASVTVVIGFMLAPISTARVDAADVGTPVAFKLCPAEGEDAIEKCHAIGDPASYVVPPGRLLTIEQVSGDCGDDGEVGAPLRIGVEAQTGGVSVPHWIIGIPNPDSVGGLIPLTHTRIYADPDSGVTIDLNGVPAFSGRFCRLSFSGTLTKP